MRPLFSCLAGLAGMVAAPFALAGLPYNGPSLSFMPIGGIIISGGNITVTPSGGQPGTSTAYMCFPPPGVSVTQASGLLMAGDTPRTLNVSCPAGTPDAPMMCVASGFDLVVYQYMIDCPGSGLRMAASPPPGLLECNGVPGTLPRTEVTFSAWLPVTGLQCSLAGAGFSLAVAPSAALAAGESTRVEVACDPPAVGQPARSGTLLCSAVGGGPFAYLLSSLASATGAPTQPAVVPAAARTMLGALAAMLALVAAAALRRRA